MVRIITCDNCDKDGILPIVISFDAKMTQCSACFHTEMMNWKYYFCCIQCFDEWLRKNKVIEEGFPCQSCSGTGYSAGFVSNGICPVCKGDKKVKTTVMIGIPSDQ